MTAMDEEADPIRILIADDHQVVREGLKAMLERQSDFRVVGEAADGRECLAQFDRLHPDVVVVDLRMPVLDGYGVIEALAAHARPAAVVVLTTYEGDNDVRRALKAGARGYLLKDAPRELVWQTLRRVHIGQRALSPDVAEKLALSVTRSELTGRELQVLQLMAEGKSNKGIANALGITEGTTKSHVNVILEKLGVRSRTGAVVIAAGRGLVRLEAGTPDSNQGL